MNWLTRLVPARIRTSGASKKVPEGLWAKCPECKAVLYRTELEHNLEVCPRCSHHLRIGARQRLNAFLDAEPRQEIGAELEAVDVHKFKDTKRYRDRLLATQKETAERDALVVYQGALLGRPLVAADFATKAMGAVGAGFVAFLVMISCLGANNGFIFTGPRVYYAMAREGLFLRAVGKLHPVYGTPFHSLVLQGLWACVMVFLLGTYEELFTSVVFVGWVFYGLAAAGVIILRRKRPDWPRPYRCWGYPWVPVLFVLAAIALIANTFATDFRSSLIGTLLTASGVPAYWFWKRRAGSAAH